MCQSKQKTRTKRQKRVSPIMAQVSPIRYVSPPHNQPQPTGTPYNTPKPTGSTHTTPFLSLIPLTQLNTKPVDMAGYTPIKHARMTGGRSVSCTRYATMAAYIACLHAILAVVSTIVAGISVHGYYNGRLYGMIVALLLVWQTYRHKVAGLIGIVFANCHSDRCSAIVAAHLATSCQSDRSGAVLSSRQDKFLQLVSFQVAILFSKLGKFLS